MVVTMADAAQPTNALREFRGRKGWTLHEVSGLTGYSAGYLSLVERGMREPSPVTKVRIARGVGAQVRDLFPLDEREPAVIP
jgi:transcriptional regulator with XRE-family HTH domain